MSYLKNLIAICLLCLFSVSCTTTSDESAHNDLSPLKQAHAAIDQGAIVIDVRRPEEYSLSHLDGAINIPHSELADRISEIETYKDKPVVLYCRSGHRAGIAKEILESKGFQHAINAGGLTDLKSEMHDPR